MKEYCNLSCEMGKSRLFSVNIKKRRLKLYFAIKLTQILSNYEVLIKIDETIFLRDNKITHSWLSKGNEFKNNQYLIK